MLIFKSINKALLTPYPFIIPMMIHNSLSFPRHKIYPISSNAFIDNNVMAVAIFM